MVVKNNDRSDVGSYIVTRCSRCNNDMNHVVVAKGADGNVARVKCLVCSSEHNYKSAKKISLSTPKVRKVTPTGTRSSSVKLFEEAKQSSVNKVPVNYNITEMYVKGTLLQHPNWGQGVVFKVYDNKVDVVFQDSIRTLVHNRK